jgi:DNA-binding beta-propeller fold protein YncE
MRFFKGKPSMGFPSALLFIFTFFFAGGALSADRAYFVYVACESDDEVAVVKFDEKQATVHKRIPVGVWPVENEGPHGITVSPDGQYWFLSMAHGKPYGHVYKYTTGDDELLGRVELDLFPATMQISNATGLLYVVNFNLHGDHVPSTVSVVDPESLTELERVQTGVMPHGSRISPDGLHHYSVAMMDGLLYEIDALSFEVVRTLPVGKDGMADGHHIGGQMHDMKSQAKPPKPTWVYPHPSESFVYVANNGADEVVEVDLQTWKITRRFPTSPGPYNVEVSADGKFMAVTYKSDASTGIWDLKKGKELAKIANSRKVSHGVVVSPDSRYAFVSVEGKGGQPGAVDIIDLNKKKKAATVDVGKQAGGIAFWKIVE